MSSRDEQLESAIVRSIVDEILSHNLRISVWEGGDWAINYSKDAEAIMAALRSTDSDKLYINKEGVGRPIGWVLLVWGNQPWEVVADYTESVGGFFQKASACIERCEASGNWGFYLQ